MLLAGLDIGTTGCKITVYRENGEYLGRVYQDYPLSRDDVAHEIDALDLWQAAREVIAKAAAEYPGIGGIGVTSFGETFVLLDSEDHPLAPCMLNTDLRGGAECDRLVEKLGRDRLADLSGHNPHPMYSIAKLIWVKENRPELYQKTRRVCLIADYVVYMLTGRAQIDYALAARTMALDIRKLCWCEEIFTAADLDAALFSTPVPIGTSAGTLRLALARELNLPPEAIVVSAGHDQVAAAIGSGVFDETCAVDGAGTVECITPVFGHIPSGDRFVDSHYAVVPYIEGQYVTYAFSFTGGALAKWFVDNLAGYAAADAERDGARIYTKLEGDTPLDVPTGLLVLPHFAGAATPYMDPGSRGAIVGLTLGSTQQEIFCGIMEGVCYEMLINKQRLNAAGIHFDSLRATGGGAVSRVWMQMKADVLGVPVTSLRSAEAGATGSAMMVGVALGLFKTLREAAAVMIVERETYLPREEQHRAYAAVFKRYEKLYDAVRPLV